MSRAQGYQPLSTDPYHSAPTKAVWISRRILVGLVIIETLALLAVLGLLARTSHTCTPRGPILYSPALPVVENEVRVFDVGSEDGDPSPFQIPSSPELDHLRKLRKVTWRAQ
ncbi:hypothetical protein B0H12DRAFT_1237539 [Mycena haematopus]|nr:hypothetical protein B0H12DRAFT_1237539 [Mycena haematopus]